MVTVLLSTTVCWSGLRARTVRRKVSLLLKEGANSVLLDNRGWTPVMYADFDGRKVGFEPMVPAPNASETRSSYMVPLNA